MTLIDRDPGGSVQVQLGTTAMDLSLFAELSPFFLMLKRIFNRSIIPRRDNATPTGAENVRQKTTVL